MLLPVAIGLHIVYNRSEAKELRDREADREGYSSLIAAAFFDAVGQRIGQDRLRLRLRQRGRADRPAIAERMIRAVSLAVSQQPSLGGLRWRGQARLFLACQPADLRPGGERQHSIGLNP
jgi:ribose 1,5-bisphosphokinase PhnN